MALVPGWDRLRSPIAAAVDPEAFAGPEEDFAIETQGRRRSPRLDLDAEHVSPRFEVRGDVQEDGEPLVPMGGPLVFAREVEREQRG